MQSCSRFVRRFKQFGKARQEETPVCIQSIEHKNGFHFNAKPYKNRCINALMCLISEMISSCMKSSFFRFLLNYCIQFKCAQVNSVNR